MIELGWGLISITVVILMAQYVFFRKQKEECEKYPFFKLRDDVILELAKTSDSKELLHIYDLVNGTIQRLDRFNFRFFAGVMGSIVHDLLEHGYKVNFDLKKKPQLKSPKLHPLEKQFINLVLNTAKRNSILLKFSMTKLGSKILATAAIPIGVLRFFRSHPELFKGRVKTMRQYAETNHIFDDGCLA